MNREIKDWTGVVIGNITVLSLNGTSKGESIYKCQCLCGNLLNIPVNNLKRSKGIGCAECRNKYQKSAKTKHGESDTRLHIIWQRMIIRCTKPYDKSYKDYGGRGITVCDEWMVYTNFRDWALSNGYSAILTLERREVNGNYNSVNCTWATRKEQANNKRNNRIVEIGGISKTLSQWCDIYGTTYHLVKGRLKRGISMMDALTLPKSKPFQIKNRTIPLLEIQTR